MMAGQIKEFIQYAPYPVEIYRNLLFMVQKSSHYHCRTYLPLEENRKDKINIFFRQDIDTKRCIENMGLLIEAHREFDLKSNLYFRVDDREYRLKDYRDRIREYYHEGFEVGLHTLCYLADDYMKEFARETEKFADEVGFRPRSFTIHGLGEYRLNERRAFIEKIVNDRDRLGYLISDCHPKLFRIDAFHEDCNWDAETKQRFMTSRFIGLPGYLKLGQSCLVLTHPMYWERGKICGKSFVSWNQISPGARICLYGTGKAAELFEMNLSAFGEGNKVVCYMDSFKKGKRNGCDVILPDEFEDFKLKFDMIVVASSYWEDIEKKLISMGIENYLINRIPFLLIC